MNPVTVAEIRIIAEREERQKIARNIKLLASQGREQARVTGRDDKSTFILDKIADMIESGEFSQ